MDIVVSYFDAGGDLSKRWYVYYTDGGKRIRRYGDLNAYKTLPARKKALMQLLLDVRMEVQRRKAEAVVKWIEDWLERCRTWRS
ncbi:MAG: hypothetical protein NW241_10890 [Bacteroidia bacterium]|nr:hypothetical protein [Bacteroidia bacterium]